MPEHQEAPVADSGQADSQGRRASRRSQPKIVFVMSKYSVGGAETQLAALMERRPEQARHVELHTITILPTESENVEKRYADAGVINHLVDRSKASFPVFFIQLLRTLAKIRPQIVHTLLDSSTGAWGRLAANLVGVPVIIHSDLALMEEGTRAHFMLRPYLDRITTRFLPNADSIADRLVAKGVPRDKIRVIPNGVDLNRFDARPPGTAREALGIPQEAVVAGFLGRFAKEKRIDLLLDAVVRLPEELRPDVLLLAGDGPLMHEIRGIVDDTPWLARSCRLLGVINDAPSFLSAVDYLVLTSDTEGLPNVLLEAMAMGKPVVSTAISDIPQRVGDTGFLAEPGNADSIASALRRMQELSPKERQDMGQRARERIRNQHEMNRIADRFWHAHLELLP